MFMQEILQYQIFEIASVRQVIVIMHLFGLALGAGVAFYSESLFSNVLKDRVISKDEYRLINNASFMIWIGLTILFVSGLILFLSNIQAHLDSPKFLAKMSIVFILFINGLLFRYVHVPVLKKIVGKDIRKSKEFAKMAKPFFISGAISGTSWAAALVLGSLRSIPLSYLTIMLIYALVLAGASMLGLKLAKKYTS